MTGISWEEFCRITDEHNRKMQEQSKRIARPPPIPLTNEEYAERSIQYYRPKQKYTPHSALPKMPSPKDLDYANLTPQQRKFLTYKTRPPGKPKPEDYGIRVYESKQCDEDGNFFDEIDSFEEDEDEQERIEKELRYDRDYKDWEEGDDVYDEHLPKDFQNWKYGDWNEKDDKNGGPIKDWHDFYQRTPSKPTWDTDKYVIDISDIVNEREAHREQHINSLRQPYKSRVDLTKEIMTEIDDLHNFYDGQRLIRRKYPQSLLHQELTGAMAAINDIYYSAKYGGFGKESVDKYIQRYNWFNDIRDKISHPWFEPWKEINMEDVYNGVPIDHQYFTKDRRGFPTTILRRPLTREETRKEEDEAALQKYLRRVDKKAKVDSLTPGMKDYVNFLTEQQGSLKSEKKKPKPVPVPKPGPVHVTRRAKPKRIVPVPFLPTGDSPRKLGPIG